MLTVKGNPLVGRRRDNARAAARGSPGPPLVQKPSSDTWLDTRDGIADLGVGGPAQALELAPQALARPALTTYKHHPWPGVRHDGRAVVHVAGRGDGRADTRLDWQYDLDDALASGDERLDPIAGANLRRRLCRGSIHEDVAAVAQPARLQAGLREAHRAQPAIDTRPVSSGAISHAF